MILKNKIYFGDCLELMKQIPDKSIDLIVSDPPFGEFSKLKWDQIINLEQMWNEYKRIIKDNCPILIFASGRFKYELYNSNSEWFKYDLVWKKSKASNPFNAKYMPLRKHEYILVFGKNRITYNPQLLEGTPYKRNYTLFKTNNMGFGVKGIEIDNLGIRQPNMVLDYPQVWRKQDQLYPTMKPVELLQWLIRSYSNESDIVFDNTMGSGTTLIAALKEKRNYLGFDNNIDAFNITEKRINDFILNKRDYFEN